MKISNEYPPNIEKIRKFFKVGQNAMFAYGDTIYNPANVYLDPSVIKHEEVHLKQMEDYGVEKWWDRYLIDSKFRASQEVSAYQVQYKELKNHIKDRNKLFEYTKYLARDLSGESYGNVMTFQEALDAIRDEKPIVFNV